jgi:hypothetical protein
LSIPRAYRKRIVRSKNNFAIDKLGQMAFIVEQDFSCCKTYHKRSFEMSLKTILSKRSNGQAGSLLKGSDVPAGTTTVIIEIAAVRESPEGFGAPLILEFKKHVYGTRRRYSGMAENIAAEAGRERASRRPQRPPQGTGRRPRRPRYPKQALAIVFHAQTRRKSQRSS